MPTLEQASTMQDLDDLCEEWIECEWARGTPLGMIGDALCGVHHFWPQAKGFLKGSWKLFRNWRKLEIPQRAPPLPRVAVLALVGYFMSIVEPHMAFLVALGFHAYLRTGEILRLQVKDIHLNSKRGAVTIRRSKTGLRFNIDETVAIYDRHLLSFWELCHIPKKMHPEAFVWEKSATAFRALFYQALRTLKLEDSAFQPYSLRRGGATADFGGGYPLEGVVVRGRWRSIGVARLYLEDGVSQMTQLKWSPASTSRLTSYASGLPPHFLA